MLVAVRAVAVTPLGALGGWASVGGWASEHGVVDAVSVARLERLPAASRASTSNVCVVPHFRPVTLAAGWVTVAAVDPFRYTTYAATATLSVEPDHSSEMLASLAEPTRRFLGRDGRVVSADGARAAQGAVADRASDRGERLPAAS